jgi:hypothetical protein
VEGVFFVVIGIQAKCHKKMRSCSSNLAKAAADTMEVMERQELGRRSQKSDFVFEAVLGRGTFGAVHKATRRADGRMYAIKQIDLLALSKAEQVDSVKEVQVGASTRL